MNDITAGKKYAGSIGKIEGRYCPENFLKDSFSYFLAAGLKAFNQLLAQFVGELTQQTALCKPRRQSAYQLGKSLFLLTRQG